MVEGVSVTVSTTVDPVSVDNSRNDVQVIDWTASIEFLHFDNDVISGLRSSGCRPEKPTIAMGTSTSSWVQGVVADVTLVEALRGRQRECPMIFRQAKPRWWAVWG